MFYRRYFGSCSKDENRNLSSSATSFDALYSLENYIQVYFNVFSLTLNFQVQFTKVQCTVNAKNAIKCALKQE